MHPSHTSSVELHEDVSNYHTCLSGRTSRTLGYSSYAKRQARYPLRLPELATLLVPFDS